MPNRQTEDMKEEAKKLLESAFAFACSEKRGEAVTAIEKMIINVRQEARKEVLDIAVGALKEIQNNPECLCANEKVCSPCLAEITLAKLEKLK